MIELFEPLIAGGSNVLQGIIQWGVLFKAALERALSAKEFAFILPLLLINSAIADTFLSAILVAQFTLFIAFSCLMTAQTPKETNTWRSHFQKYRRIKGVR